MRAALVTLNSWEDCYERLRLARISWEETIDNLPIARCPFIQVRPVDWDAPSFAETLREASLGFPASRLLAGPGRATIRAMDLVRYLNGPGQRPRIQGAAYDAIVGSLYPNSLPLLISRRISSLFPQSDFYNRVCISDALTALDKQTKACAIMVIKSWLNGWSTSSRFHEETIQVCLWGCRDEVDAMRHYVLCPRMWLSIEAAVGERVTTDPLERLAIANPNQC